MMRLIIIGAISVLMLSCNSSTEDLSSISLDAKINKEIRISNEVNIIVKSIYDSRCPEGCQCIWAGEVKVFFTLNEDSSQLDTSLILPTRPKMLYGNFSIEIKSVNPYPICNYEFPSDPTILFQIVDLSK